LDRETRRPGDQLWWLTLGTSISASVHGGDRVDQVKTVGEWVEWEGSGGLGVRAVEDGVARVSGGCAGVCYSRLV
jgi:hypothetical protein